MGLFKQSPQEIDVEKATNENNIHDDWSLIIEVCDKAGKSEEEAKNYLRAIIKRLHHQNPHVALQAVTLLDACVNNCGKTFHLEVASNEFETEFLKLINKGHPKVTQKLKECLKKWAEGEFKSNPQLSLIPSLYSRLRNRGIDFSPEAPTKKSVVLSKDPNVVQSQDEEDQIAKAIELSLKETTNSPRAASSSLYPSTNLESTNLSVSANATPQKEIKKVRALYDFEAAEDNELTFNSGEIIVVLDDSDANWWKGSNQRGEGLFPASFVTTDLSVEPEKSVSDKKKTDAVKIDENKMKDVEAAEINEDKIDRLLHLLHEADPTNSDRDTEEMLLLEKEVNTMGPLIDNELERVDRKHAQLTQLSSDLVEALSLYHTLMREPQIQPQSKIPFGYSQQSHFQPQGFSGNFPPQHMGTPIGNQFNSFPPGQDRPFIPISGPHVTNLPIMSQGFPVQTPPHPMQHMPPSSLPIQNFSQDVSLGPSLEDRHSMNTSGFQGFGQPNFGPNISQPAQNGSQHPSQSNTH